MAALDKGKKYVIDSIHHHGKHGRKKLLSYARSLMAAEDVSSDEDMLEDVEFVDGGGVPGFRFIDEQTPATEDALAIKYAPEEKAAMIENELLTRGMEFK
jgi:hypothetical protein